MLAFAMCSTRANTVSAAIDSATTSVKETVTYVDTSSNFKHVYSDIKAGIAGLAAGLKVGAEHVYTVLVKQQIVYSITWLVFIIILLLLSTVFRKVLYNHAREEWDDELFGLFCIFGGTILIIGYIIVLCNLTTITTGLINPEYGAIKDIINFIK